MSQTPNLICSLCSSSFDNSQNLISTNCLHTFHKDCLMPFLEKSPLCPICKSSVSNSTLTQFRLSSIIQSSQGAIPKSKTSQPKFTTRNTRCANRLQEIDNNRNLALPLDNLELNSSVENNSTEVNTDTLPKNPVTAGSDLSNEIKNIYRTIEMLSQKLEQVNFNRIQPDFPRDLFPIDSRHTSYHNIQNSSTNFRNINEPNIAGMRSSGMPNSNPNETGYNRHNNSCSPIALANSSKVASVINSWNIRFDGSLSNFPVGKFLYVITALTTDNLGGDFQLLCDHFHILLCGRAKEWYWRYRGTTRQITWEPLENALRSSFADHLSDNDIREMIRERKQLVGESFDEYYAAILNLCDRMQYQLLEIDLVEALRRNLRPQLRRELFYIDIKTVAQLRHLVLRREVLNNDLEKLVNRPTATRRISALDYESGEEKESYDISEIKDFKDITCWNCRGAGHRFTDCMKDRTIFCYGCGAENVFKPNCLHCQNQGNLKSSGSRSKK